MAVDVEKRKAYNTMWRRNKRAKDKAAKLNGANGDNGSATATPELDAYSFPIGTCDAEGRKLGQLDDLEKERDQLTAELATYEKKREALEKEKYAVPLPSAPDTLKKEIDTRAHLIAINELIEESDAKITAIKDAIIVKTRRIKQLEAHYEMAKKHRDEYSKGGIVYKDKIAYAEYALKEAEQKKRAAKATLKESEHNSDAQVQLNCANLNIAEYSNVEGWLGAERQKYEDVMKLYRR